MRRFFPTAPREQSRVPSPDSIGGVTSFMQLRRHRHPVTTRDETRVSHCKSRRAPCFPAPLEMRAHSLLQFKKNPNFPSHHKRRSVSPIESRVEPHGFSCKEKGHRVAPQLQISPDSPAPIPMEHRGSTHNMMEGLTLLLILLKYLKFPT